MSMAFQTIKTALVTTLKNAAAGRFRTDPAMPQSMGSSDIEQIPLVHVFYAGGEFPKISAPIRGKTIHEAKYSVLLTVAQPCYADLATLEDPTSTALEITTALSAVQAANEAADTAFDNLVAIVWNILRDPQNEFLGLDRATYSIANLWIDSVVKENPLNRGEVVIISGSLNLSIRCVEYPPSQTTTPGLAIINTLQATADKTGATLDPAPIGAKVGT